MNEYFTHVLIVLAYVTADSYNYKWDTGISKSELVLLLVWLAIGLGSTGNHFSLYLSYNFFIAALCGALLVLYMCGHLVVILTPTLPLISIPILSPSLLCLGTRIVPFPTA